MRCHQFFVIWSICLHFKKDSEYLTSETAHVFIPLIRCLLQSLVSRSFLTRLRYSFLIFFHLRFFDGVHFQYFQILVVFSLKWPDSFLIWQFYSFCFFLFPLFIRSISHFWYQISSYILVVYPHYLYQSSIVFIFLQTDWCCQCT